MSPEIKIDVKSVSDIMQRDPVTVDPDMSLRQAVEVLRDAGVGGAPVVRGEKLVGVLSGTDVLEFEATSPGVPTEREAHMELGGPEPPAQEDEPEDSAAFYFARWSDSGGDAWNRISETDTPEWDRLEEHTVAEIMSRGLVTVPVDASLPEAARLMLEREVHRVLVVDGDELVGLLSAFDVVRLVADSSRRSDAW